MRISVISPTLNEAENIPRLVEELDRVLVDIDHEILIVDDNSPDRTWHIAEEIASTNPRVKAIRRMHDPGLSDAVIDGFSAAEGDVVACIDADLQHDPAILARMLNELHQGADAVVGSRHIEGGSTGDWARARRVQSWIATKAAQLLLGIRLKDPMSGYFLIWRKDFEEIKEQLNGKGFKILLEILAMLNASNIKEVPYTFRARARGQSKLSGRVILQYLYQLWRLCSSSRRLSIRFMKSIVVGGVGVVFNLATMALIMKVTRIRDWRTSAAACLLANLQNYLLHGALAYVFHSKEEFRKREGYLSYLLLSVAGMFVTVVSYSILTWSLLHALSILNATVPSIFTLRLACQFLAIVLGVRFNYTLNRVFDWPDLERINLEAPARDVAIGD